MTDPDLAVLAAMEQAIRLRASAYSGLFAQQLLRDADALARAQAALKAQQPQASTVGQEPWQIMRRVLGAEHADRLAQLRAVLRQTADNHPDWMPKDEELAFIVQCSLVWIAALDAAQAALTAQAELQQAMTDMEGVANRRLELLHQCRAAIHSENHDLNALPGDIRRALEAAK